MTQGILDVVQKLGSATPATFTCNVSGVPQPEIRWIHKGVELTSGSGQVSVSVRKSPSGIVVTSVLEFQGPEEEDAGGVQCVAYHVVGGGVRMTASKANLIVLRKWGCGGVECGGVGGVGGVGMWSVGGVLCGVCEL